MLLFCNEICFSPTNIIKDLRGSGDWGLEVRDGPLGISNPLYNCAMSFDTIFFDLDATLYPESNGLWPAIREKIDQYMKPLLQQLTDQELQSDKNRQDSIKTGVSKRSVLYCTKVRQT